jgi:hypothetical protein
MVVSMQLIYTSGNLIVEGILEMFIKVFIISKETVNFNSSMGLAKGKDWIQRTNILVPPTASHLQLTAVRRVVFT